MHRLKRSFKSSAPAVERQASVEYLDSLSYQDDKEREQYSSTPDLITDTPTKKKKKRHFRGVFGRHKDRHKSSPLDDRLHESLPSRSSPLLNDNSLSVDTPSHLSLNHSWSHSQWNSLDPEKKMSSAHSSNMSLLSVESDLKELSDEEMVESLVHPQRSDSFRPSMPVSAAIFCLV